MAAPNKWEQQALAMDARYNTIRLSNCSNFRTLYMRRRSQLLREKQKSACDDISDEDRRVIRKNYIRQRATLLGKKYGAIFSEQSSVRSLISHRGGRMDSLSESMDSLDVSSLSRFKRAFHRQSSLSSSRQQQGFPHSFSTGTLLNPESDTSFEENYSFSGVQHIFDQHTSAVTALAFANDDASRLACASMDSTLSICQVLPPPATVIAVLRGHQQGVTDLQWSQANDLLLSCSLDGALRLWRVADAKCIRIVPDPSEQELLCARFQPHNNNLVVQGGSKGFLLSVNVSTGKAVGRVRLSGRVTAIAFDAGGLTLWAGESRGAIHAFRVEASGRLQQLRKAVMVAGPLMGLVFRSWLSRMAREPLLLASGSSLMLFRVEVDGRLVLRNQMPVPGRGCLSPLLSFRRGVCVFLGGADGQVLLVDVERQARLTQLQGHSAPVRDVAFNADESLLASGDEDGIVIVWMRRTN